MRARPTCALLLILLLAQNYLSAQEKLNLKFGKISAADFDLSKHNFDTSAGAVYIVEYEVSNSENHLTLHSRVKLGKAYFQPADYNALRNFFAQVVAKHAEVVVFRKK